MEVRREGRSHRRHRPHRLEGRRRHRHRCRPHRDRQPVGGILEVARPDRYPLDDLVRTRLRASNDTRRVVTDPQARYFGVVLDDQTLVPATTATVFPTRFEDWLIDNAPAPVR